MVKYCPSCGAEVKEGSKFCLGCGAQLQAEASAPQAAQTPPPVAPVPPPQQPMPQQTYAPTQPKKTNTKLILGIIIAIVAIVVVLLVVFLFLGGGGLSGEAGKFVGTWEVDISGFFTYEMKFNSDKSLEYGMSGYSSVVGTWDVQDGKLVTEITASGSDLVSQEYDYEFSNGGNTLILQYDGYDYMTLTKK